MLATCSTPRRERTKARVRTSSRTRSVSSSAVSEEAARRTGAPFSPRNEVKGGSHSARVTAPRGEWSPVTASTSRPVSRDAATLGLGHGRGGEHEGGGRAVQRGDPPQPAQDLGDVRPEDAPVVVALVDDDVLEARPERRPPPVPRQHRAVQHVGVGEDVLAEVARPVPLLAAAVPVVGGHPDVEAEGLERGELVLGERLGRREVEHARRRAGPGDPAPPGSP